MLIGTGLSIWATSGMMVSGPTRAIQKVTSQIYLPKKDYREKENAFSDNNLILRIPGNTEIACWISCGPNIFVTAMTSPAIVVAKGNMVTTALIIVVLLRAEVA